MKHLIFFIMLMPHILGAQTFDAQKEKYWIYRERLKNFVVNEACDGCGIPANSRQKAADHTMPDRLNFGDAPWQIGYWLGTLAMEYKLLSKVPGLSPTGPELMQTKKDIYYAMEAINRLDYEAEESWGCAKELNGFLIPDDIHSGFPAQIVNGETINDLMNEGLVPPPDAFRLECMNSAEEKFIQNREASKDHMIGLFIGLRLVRELIEPTVNYNNQQFAYEQAPIKNFVAEAQAISHRITYWLYSNNWVYKNKCTGKCVFGIKNEHFLDPCDSPFTHVTAEDCSGPYDYAECCDAGGALGQPEAIGFAAVNMNIQAGGPLMGLATVIFHSVYTSYIHRYTWNGALLYPTRTSRLPRSLAALGNVWRMIKIGPFIIFTSPEKIAKHLRDLVENGDLMPDPENEFAKWGRYWEHLILFHRLLYGTHYDSFGNPIKVSDTHYECLLNAAPCRGWDGVNTGYNAEWGWTDRLDGSRCDDEGAPCDGNSDARVDYMFYFNLFNLVAPMPGFPYSPIPIKELAPLNVNKPDVSANASASTPYIEYDKKNFQAANNISAQNYVITDDPVEGKGRVTFAAGNKIILGDGFKVTNGGYFHGYIDPTIQAMNCTEPANTNCEGVFKKSGEIITDTLPEEDTLICSLDSMQIFLDGDTLLNNSYHWDFGNGITSDSSNPFIYYTSPGTYNLVLILTDSLGNKDTISYPLTIMACPDDVPPSARLDAALTGANEYHLSSNSKQGSAVSIVPNPSASGIFNVLVPNSEIIPEIVVTNILGEKVLMTRINSMNSAIDISSQPKGIYFVLIHQRGEISVQKIVYQ